MWQTYRVSRSGGVVRRGGRPSVSSVPLGAAQQAPSPDRTMWSGVYTGRQAARGKPRFETSCIRCPQHRADRFRTWTGPQGQRILVRSGRTIASAACIIKIRDTMPQDGGAAVVSDEVKVDILAYYPSTERRAGRQRGVEAGHRTQLEGVKIAKRGIWDGVFTAAQADRGNRLPDRPVRWVSSARFERRPGSGAQGRRILVALGERQRDRACLPRFGDTMPPNSPNDTTEDAKIDVVAYPPAVQRFPGRPFRAEAGRGSAWMRSEIVRKVQGSKRRISRSFRSSGCLAQGQNNAWVLTEYHRTGRHQTEEPNTQRI